MKTILALLFINKKKKLFLLAGIIALLIFSCNNRDDIIQEGQDKPKSRLVFYTNAQAILNCGPFDVDIFIGNVPVGSISYSYINDELPDCIQSDNTLLVEKDTGTYSYFAQATYSDIFHWTGTIDIKPDSCHKVFLDVEHAEGLTRKGSVVFYTNIQALTNCGPYNVYVFIDNDSIGLIEEPSSNDHDPDCIASKKTVVLEKEPGIYHYVAEAECGEFLNWNGEFEIFPDSCTKIFLDIESTNSYNQRGKAVFYTDEKTLSACTPFHVIDIYVENDFLWTLQKPYTDSIPPICEYNAGRSALFKSLAGIYVYVAKSKGGTLEWHGKFEIIPDSCTKIFLGN